MNQFEEKPPRVVDDRVDKKSGARLVSADDYDADLELLDCDDIDTLRGRVTVAIAGTPVSFDVPPRSSVQMIAAGRAFSWDLTEDGAKFAGGSGPRVLVTQLRNTAADDSKTVYVDAEVSGTVVSWNVVKQF